jgi:predicted nucleic acid-binding protein
MSAMPELVIADTSCSIALSRVGGLHLLKDLYGSVWTTSIVVQEFGSPLPDWVKVTDPNDQLHLRMLMLTLDRGEASAIALGLEVPGCVLVLDERKGRNVARMLGLSVTGTLGMLVKAKHAGLTPSLRPWLKRFQEAGFRYSQEVETAVLRAAGGA